MMLDSRLLVDRLTSALDEIPLVDPHSHIDPIRPTSRTLDDILGYHYYTELAHSAGMSQTLLSTQADPRERCHEILKYLDRYDNTAQAAWLLDIAQTFLGFTGDRITANDADQLWNAAEATFAADHWEAQVFEKTKLEKIFLTNEFDDPLVGFDTQKYVPCLRTDTLVFQLDQPTTRTRLAQATGVTVGDGPSLRRAIRKLFEHFTQKNAKACAISLPPDFTPIIRSASEVDTTLANLTTNPDRGLLAVSVFQILAECCREFGLPFDLMIGVNRKVYERGVFQGQDLYDRRTSLIQYRELFNQFPEVTFPISVLTSGQNQELVSYSWIFPNVTTNGHWWYSNIPAYIERDLRERLQAVPKTKQIGYYSDAYKLEFVLPKFRMYRGILARVLAEEFVLTRRLTETEAVSLGQQLLRDNVLSMFRV